MNAGQRRSTDMQSDWSAPLCMYHSQVRGSIRQLGMTGHLTNVVDEPAESRTPTGIEKEASICTDVRARCPRSHYQTFLILIIYYTPALEL